MKRTKIVCTIGPASESREKIKQLIAAGLDAARLNFSHGDYKHHEFLIKNIRSAAKEAGKPVAIIQDLQGPRIRIGLLSGPVKLENNQKIYLVPENYRISLKDVATFLPIQFEELYRFVKKGDPILIDDGKIELAVLGVKNKAIACKVKIGDEVTSHRGMNFPKTKISAPALTKKDLEDLAFGLKQQVDYVALSFVKDAKDLKTLRLMMKKMEQKYSVKGKDYKKPERDKSGLKTKTKIIAKIERPEAVKNFEEILAASDAIMVARGDLGLELPLQDLPLIQKKIIKRCIQEAKPVIVATQMLDSMIRFPMPTRAEVSDVANAILDGTDAIMLSGETATGKYPLRAVQVMSKIANEVESTEMAQQQKMEDEIKRIGGITETVSYAVQNIAEELKAKAIVCATTAGYTARSISKYRSRVPIMAFAPNDLTKNQMALSWGVRPFTLSFDYSFNDLIGKIKEHLLKEKLVKKNDVIVVAAGHPFGYFGQTNLIKVEKI